MRVGVVALLLALTSMACNRPSASHPASAGDAPPPTYAAVPPRDVAVTQRHSATAASSTPAVEDSGASSGSLMALGAHSKTEPFPSRETAAPSPSGQLAPSDRASSSDELAFQRMSYGSVPLRAKATARRYGNLSPAQCATELRHWKASFKRVGASKGIATPVRVIGPIEGVKFRVPGEKSKFGILDCRLALTLVEFARFLRARDVTEVVVDNFYRLNARLPSARSKRSQHAYALAIDLRSFRLADGRVWDIETDWGASTDTEACGPQATLVSPTEHTEGLRTLVCELFAEQIFSHHLTPSHDRAHRNHLHLDIKRAAPSAVIK